MIESPKKPVPAKIILIQIENGEVVDYEGITVLGDLDLSGLKLPVDEEGYHIISKPIKIKHSIIQGLTKILNIHFMGYVDFSGTTFINANFQGAIFEKFAGFEGTVFTGYASFANTRFIDDVSFTNSQFTECVQIRFDEAIFYKDVYFWSRQGKNTIFGGSSHFSHARFNGIAEFSGVIFLNEANFSLCRFYGEYIQLLDSQFRGKVSFIGSIIKGRADFRNNKFDNVANFSKVSFNIIDFSAAQFKESLYLTGITFSRFVVQWNTIEERLICDDSVFLALITNFKNLGQFDDSDNCYYRYKRQIQNQRGIGLRKVIDLLSYISCGYGVRPFRTLCLSMLLITIFALLFWYGRGIEELQSIKEAFYYSALTFTANSKSINWIGIYKYIGLIEGFLGWLFMALFLVTLGRTWLR